MSPQREKVRVATSTAQAIVRKYDGPTSYRTKSSYDRKINVKVRRNRHKLSYDEIRTIAGGHFVHRTSVFYTRTMTSYDSLCRCLWGHDSLWRP